MKEAEAANPRRDDRKGRPCARLLAFIAVGLPVKIAGRGATHPRVASLALQAIHLLAIFRINGTPICCPDDLGDCHASVRTGSQ